MTKEERKNLDKEIDKIVKAGDLLQTEYIGDYKGSSVYAGEAYMFTRKNKFGKPVYHTGLFALDKKSGKCDYVWTPPGSDGWKLMQNARKIDVF